MRKTTFILSLLFVFAGYTLASCVFPKDCAELSRCLNAPYYYCDCKNNSVAFAYGLDTVLSDTTWYSAKLIDLQDGLTAYWFSTGSVQIDIFPLCISDTALMSTTIGQNRAYNVSSDYISEKLQSISGTLPETLKNMEVHIRVVPQNGVSGRVVMTSYNEGYHSTCANPLPLHYNMAYVLSNPDNVYRLTYTAMPSQMAVQWIQNESQPVNIELAVGSCTAPALATAQLTDSAHVWLPQLSVLQDAYSQNQSLFFRFSTNAVGRVWFVSPVSEYTYQVDTTLCQGIPLQLSDTALTQTTVYTDTFYLSRTDSLLLTTYNLTVTPPSTDYDTMSVESTSFPFLYKGQGVVNRYGTFTYLIHNEGACDKRIQLTVKPVELPSMLDTPPSLIHVYPTIAAVGQDITFSLPQSAVLSIYDIVGNLVLSREYNAGIHAVQLNRQGNYILQLSTCDHQYPTRIVVQ